MAGGPANLFHRQRCAGASLSIRRHNQGHAFVALSIRLRDRLEQALRLGLEDEPAVAGVLVGMIIGERAAIPPDTYADFQRTGVFHVFAINGLHVGLVTIVILMFLRLLGIPRRWPGRSPFHCWRFTCSPRARIPAPSGRW